MNLDPKLIEKLGFPIDEWLNCIDYPDVTHLSDLLFYVPPRQEPETGVINGEYGRVVRKAVNKYKSNFYYKYFPFGIVDGKVVVPEYYTKYIVCKNGSPNMELIYNIMMLSSNFNYWFLLTRLQKVELFECLKSNADLKVFGYRDKPFTFADLLEQLTNRIIVRDDNFTQIYLAACTKESRNEYTNFNQNGIPISYLLKQICYELTDIHIEKSIHHYKPLIYFFMKDRLCVTKLKEEDYFINGVPQTKRL